MLWADTCHWAAAPGIEIAAATTLHCRKAALSPEPPMPRDVRKTAFDQTGCSNSVKRRAQLHNLTIRLAIANFDV
jgi:hypothetical protein